MRNSTLVCIVAILSITALEITAVIKGMDGYLFGLTIAAISGLAGYKLHEIIKK